MASNRFFFPEELSAEKEDNPDYKNMKKLFRLLHERCGQHCTPKSLQIATLLSELGYIYRVKQLWLQCPCLVEITRKLGLFAEFSSDSIAIDGFINEANKCALLKDLLYKWIDEFGDCTTPNDPSHTYTFLE